MLRLMCKDQHFYGMGSRTQFRTQYGNSNATEIAVTAAVLFVGVMKLCVMQLLKWTKLPYSA